MRLTIFTSFIFLMNFQKFFLLIFFINFSAEAAPYFPANSISPLLLDPPFKPQSAEWQNDIKEIVKMQKKFAPEEIDQALEEYHLRPETVILTVEPSLTRADYPQLYKLFDRVEETSRNSTEVVKNYWNTKRPYLSDKRVSALITPHDNPSYPSGHTTGSYLYAHIMGLLVPQKRAEFEARAAQIARHRVLVGMHYPNDVVGGKQMALLLVGGLAQNPEFQKDFAAAQKELEKK